MSLSPENNSRYWMLRALRLATRSLGRTSPNPGVAACIVRDGTLLGEGRHQVCGQEHAEVAAIRDCVRRGNNPHGADIYITLAPCTALGRTGACTQAIIDAGLKRVFAAIADPQQDDASNILAAAGVAYACGLCGDYAEHLHGGFLNRVRHKRARVTGKWAMSIDGHLACHSGHSAWLSSEQALRMSRRRRRIFDAIVVGSGTLLADDPRLLASGESSPQRIVLARENIPDF